MRRKDRLKQGMEQSQSKNLLGKLRDYAAVFSAKNMIWLALLCGIAAACFSEQVNAFCDRIMGDEKVTVTLTGTSGGGVWIRGLNGNVNDYALFEQAEKKGAWEYRAAADYGYPSDMIVSREEGASITFYVEKLPQTGINFWKQAESSVVEVAAGSRTIATEDLYSGEDGGEVYSVYPFRNFRRLFLYRATAYAVLFATLYFLATLLHYFVLMKAGNEALEGTRNFRYRYLMGILFSLTLLYCIVYYRTAQPLIYYGDWAHYIDRGRTLLGISSLQEAKDAFSALPVFRGYMCYLPIMAAEWAGDILRFDAGRLQFIYIYFVISAACASALWGYAVPELYRLAHGRKPSWISVVSGWLLYGFFWRGGYLGPSSDFTGVVFLALGILFLLKGFRAGHYRHMASAGVFLAWAVLCRANYKYVVLALLAAVACRRICRRQAGRTARLMLPLAAAFLCACMPQAAINYAQGHLGLLPYDKAGAYTPYITEMEYMLNSGRTMIAAYPVVKNDSQLSSIFSLSGYTFPEKYLSLNTNQILTAYTASPLDTLVAFAKRLFFLCDVKWTAPYENIANLNVGGSRWLIFSTLNYLVWGTALYLLLNKKMRAACFQREGLLLGGLVSLTAVGPMLACHVEFRYALILYVIAYMIVAYEMTDSILIPERREGLLRSNYYAFLTCYVFVAHLISLTLFKA